MRGAVRHVAFGPKGGIRSVRWVTEEWETSNPRI